MDGKVENFIVFYKKQDVNERRRIRDEFLKKSKLTYPGWYAKLRRQVFSFLELSLLGEICKKEF